MMIMMLYRAILPAFLVLVCSSRTWAQPTMDALWPNEDGRSWKYEQVYHDWFSGQLIQNEVRLVFNGTETVPGGVVVQNLEVEVLGPAPSMSDVVAPAADPFIRTLWQARPDLRKAIEEKLRVGAAESARDPVGFYQILIGEAAYRKSDEDIAGYRRDLDATKAWIWLVSDLTIGNTFEIQLVPDLADDVWLYGTIAAWEDVAVPAGFFPGCLRVDYRIDYGESICTDEYGNESGAFRSETRGFIHYAADVGPVNHQEEFIPFVEFLWGECPGWDGYQGMVFTSGTLQLTGEPPTAVRPSTWGAVKAGFRGLVEP